METYKVLVAIEHKGVLQVVGSEIELTDAEARNYLEAKEIELVTKEEVK